MSTTTVSISTQNQSAAAVAVGCNQLCSQSTSTENNLTTCIFTYIILTVYVENCIKQCRKKFIQFDCLEIVPMKTVATHNLTLFEIYGQAEIINKSITCFQFSKIPKNIFNDFIILNFPCHMEYSSKSSFHDMVDKVGTPRSPYGSGKIFIKFLNALNFEIHNVNSAESLSMWFNAIKIKNALVIKNVISRIVIFHVRWTS